MAGRVSEHSVYPPPDRTPVRQRLYNLMREAEEQEQQQQQQQRWRALARRDWSTVLLQPPTPSYAASQTTSNSDVDGGEPRARRRRNGRQGPLTPAQKWRAALMRKVGACDGCRTRRVKVRGTRCALFPGLGVASCLPTSPVQPL